MTLSEHVLNLSSSGLKGKASRPPHWQLNSFARRVIHTSCNRTTVSLRRRVYGNVHAPTGHQLYIIRVFFCFLFYTFVPSVSAKHFFLLRPSRGQAQTTIIRTEHHCCPMHAHERMNMLQRFHLKLWSCVCHVDHSK